MPTTITFNSYSLQSTSFKTRIIQHTNIPGKLIQTEARARSDGQSVVNVRYSNRVILVEGHLSAATRDLLVQKIDEMKLNLDGISGTLDIAYGSTTRRYYGTVQKLDLPEDFFNIDNVPYSIEFLCADPFGYATGSGIVSVLGSTQFLQDLIVTVSGSATGQPTARINFTTTSGVNLVTFSNETLGDAIVISKPGGGYFQALDQLVINSETKQVFLNGSGLDYSGRFPTLEPPTAALRLALQAVQVNYDLIVQYVPTYL